MHRACTQCDHYFIPRTLREKRCRRCRNPYTIAELIAAANGLCGLCGRAVPVDLRHPHPASASVDHVLPRVLGGKDVRSNVQLVHLICNSIKHCNPDGFYSPSLEMLKLA